MTTPQINLVIIVLVTFVAVNAFVLRLSCRLTNCASRWFPQCVRLTIPKYRTCIMIVFGVLVVAGLIVSASELLIASWAADLFPKRVWSVVVATAEVLLIFKLIDWGLSDEQPAPTRLVSIAALVHVLLVATMVFATGQILPGLVVGL